MINAKRLSIFVFVLIFLAGCSSTSSLRDNEIPSIPPSDLSKCKNEDEAAQILISSVLDGLKSSNYQEFTRDFSSKEKSAFTKANFDDACKAIDNNLGVLLSKQYLGSINKIDYSIAIWKAKYSKVPEDIIFEMYIVRQNDTFKISAFVPK
ncbi:MAG TPA: hypothetical protein DD381_09585 [Lentisphaeria bacterium]|nr:MAG: hypothetical protein A2X47_07460 [Lentisphaerae bacterium GWF2_38_69]HBM16575.1 hypothetical protein [Lentisphaeria bacterium]